VGTSDKKKKKKNKKKKKKFMEINTINLVGRAGREPDVRYFESGSIVANFTLAVNRRSRDEEPDWFNLEIWGKQAQIAVDYVKKGSLIGITGSFKIDSWKDKNTGEDRFKPVVRVDRLNLLGSRKDSDNNQYPNSNNSSEIPF
jgi:single-strand DNA-binding protein